MGLDQILINNKHLICHNSLKIKWKVAKTTQLTSHSAFVFSENTNNTHKPNSVETNN